MLVSTTIKESRRIIEAWRSEGLTIGFVPTMGYLHDGHKSLIERARLENDKVVVSIFVNPIQFGPNEDLTTYPRDLERDRQICEAAGVDLIFAPSVTEMYPEKNLVYIDALILGDRLCGAKREGHFRGVCTVVAKLFNIITPERAYFGEKDAQQLAIIEQMTKDLNFDVQIVPCPIVREPDGLAMSSRNTYLSTGERQAALILSKALSVAKNLINAGERNAKVIYQKIEEVIKTEALARIDYIEIVDAKLLQPVTIIDQPVLVAIAVFIGKTRLIDNFFLREVSSR
ncbi:MAG TPA: pantoate--beta-alanine ligase [Bacillota bacterium]|nr:pantoate--beta-alanine ligase [Bacillota bacterium]HOL10648.1 pantoate--beta-alanine ligase [Bacillota bacterium]HPO98051.1 pantoate--beta-alanine ligase [Bacillota bacterium]